VDESDANPDVFLEVCTCSPPLQPCEFLDFADCIAVALSRGQSGILAARRILNAGKFANLEDAILAMPNDVIGSFCESLISRDSDCSLVLCLLRVRAKDLPEYLSARLISMFFGRNRKYFDCIQYIGEVHLETTIRKILEHTESADDLDGLERLSTDRVTAIRAIRVLSDLVSNTNPRDVTSYLKLVAGFIFFLRLSEEWMKWEISLNFNDYFTCILVNYLYSPESFRDCLIAIAPSDQFADTILELSESNEEFPAKFANRFPQFVNESLTVDFLSRSNDQRICAAGILWGASYDSLDMLKNDPDRRCRKFVVRATRDTRMLLEIINDEPDTEMVLPEALVNAASNFPSLTLRLVDVGARLKTCLESFDEKGELVSSASTKITRYERRQ
jgi:hypothetical protein